ncbi:MAG TPA: hypothetical protein VFH61_04795, partial [Thermoleophilia bacterium]|nr:hypothetical protein [Thermoleophilia bacterium]
MADVGGRGSRRVFKDRILAEAASSAAAVSLAPLIFALAAGGAVVGSDRVPRVNSSGVATTFTATQMRDFVLGISGGVATIPEHLTVTGTLTKTGTGTVTLGPTTAGTLDNIVVGGTTPLAGTFTTLTANGNTVLGDATSDTITATARFVTDLVPSTANSRDLGSSALPFRSGYFGTRVGIGFTGAISTEVNLDVVSKFGVRPSSAYSYPTVMSQGFGGRFYAIHNAGDWGFVIGRAAADEFGANLTLYKTRSATGARTAVLDGDLLGRLVFQGVSQTGGTVNNSAEIRAYVNGAVSTAVLPTELRFYTVTSGDVAGGVTARMVLSSTGHLHP